MNNFYINWRGPYASIFSRPPWEFVCFKIMEDNVSLPPCYKQKLIFVICWQFLWFWMFSVVFWILSVVNKLFKWLINQKPRIVLKLKKQKTRKKKKKEDNLLNLSNVKKSHWRLIFTLEKYSFCLYVTASR